MQRRSTWVLGTVLATLVGCSHRTVTAPPPAAPVVDTEQPVVTVVNLPVAVPVVAPEAKVALPPPRVGPDSTPQSDPEAAAPPSPPKPGGSDPFRSDTVDDNKTGHEIMSKILTLPAADPPTQPATPAPTTSPSKPKK